jgi:hypothetical protein
MAYRLYSCAVKALDCTFHKAILSSTGRSTRCLRGRGITAVIREKYYPTYEFRRGSGGLVGDTPGQPGAAKKKGKGGGMARGRLVDSEIQRWVEGTMPKGPKALKNLHPFSRAFIALTQRLHLTPVASQVVVRDERCNIATLVDFVFLNAKARTVVIELKCGFEGYNEVSTGRMQGEFSYLTNSPANQHRVQLALTHSMFETTFPELGVADGLLIRMTTKGAHVRSLDKREKLAARKAVRKGSSF